ncbi:hypothetical protein Taro_007182 [Colocasia esculenta]|uniref:Uncharacterized protein n=1 Tax=Colocasia esculenta TaxID=4460 RepID=A0A843TQN9_COLES|nr:hypothetical protein [Colocasia esculenta]
MQTRTTSRWQREHDHQSRRVQNATFTLVTFTGRKPAGSAADLCFQLSAGGAKARGFRGGVGPVRIANQRDGFQLGSDKMVLDSLSSPHRRSQNPSFQASFRKPSSRDELGSWSTLWQRHRFLLTMLALLAFLCTIYLYFAVTLGGTETCSGLSGTQKALCQAKSSVIHKGKLRFF